MTLIVDSNEARNHPQLIPMLTEAGVPAEVSNSNQSPGAEWGYPDFLIWESMTGINRKTVGEWLSNSDKVVEQCQRELASPISHLVLVIEGIMVSDITGMWGYDMDWGRNTVFRRGLGQEIGTVPFNRRHYGINAKHAINELTRLEFAGVQVVMTGSLEDTISKLVAFHDLTLSGQPNNILSRLIKPDIHVQGLTREETQFAKLLMGIPGVGEQAALTLAATYSSIMELVEVWSGNGTVADLMLRGGTRRIGNALERKLQQAIGYTSRPTPLQSRQGTEESAMSTP